MNWSFLFLFLRTHRQQVPERNQKKKKKMKWRAERSASSHRFHCAILWPPSSCLSFIMHTHPHAHSHNFGCLQRNSQQWLTSGAQKSGIGGGGVGWAGDDDDDGSEGRKEKWFWNVGLMSPHNAFEWVLCYLSSIIYVSFQKSYISSIIINTELQCQWTVSKSGVIFDFNIKCGTRWLTLWGGKATRSKSPWLLENFCLFEKGKEKWRNWDKIAPCVHPTPATCQSSHFYPHTAVCILSL